MFCPNCGNKIPDDSKFCPFCGMKIDAEEVEEGSTSPAGDVQADTPDFTQSFDENGTQDFDAQTGVQDHGAQTGAQDHDAETDTKNHGAQGGGFDQSVGDGIDRLGKKLGDGLSDAAKDVEQSVRDTGREVRSRVHAAKQKNSNADSLLTPENLEKVMAIAMLVPIVSLIGGGLVCWVLGFLRILPLPFIYPLVRFLRTIVRLAFVALSIAGVAAGGMTVFSDQKKATTWGLIGFCGTIVACITCIGIFFHWPSFLTFVLSLAAAVLGWEETARVVLLGWGIEENPDIQADQRAYKDFISKAQDAQRMEQQKRAAAAAENARNAQNTAQAESTQGMQSGSYAGVQGGQYARSQSNAGAGYATNMPGTASSAPIPEDGESYFDGSGLSLFGYRLLMGLVCGVTCGLAYPWMFCKIQGWQASHTVFNGRRLEFNGSGIDLFGHYIVWWLLSMITCGLYIPFMSVSISKWEMQHTYFQGDPTTYGSFDGNGFEFYGYSTLSNMLTGITCGLLGPWTKVEYFKWDFGHTTIGRKKLLCVAKTDDIFWTFVGQYLLTVITCGIYGAWAWVKIYKYFVSKTHFDARYVG